jgi:PKD repeat protein
VIGIRELASLVASVIVLFGSVMVPAGDTGTVAVEEVGGDTTRAVADEPVTIDLDETKVYDLVTSRGAPTPPASLEGGYETLDFVVAPGQDTSIQLGDREIPVPGGSSVEVEGFSGKITALDDAEGLALSLTGTATSLETSPPQAPAVETSDGSAPQIPATNISVNGDVVTGGIEQGGSFDELEFTVTPANGSDTDPTLSVGDELFPFEQTVRVRVANYVGLVAVVDTDRDRARLHLDGYGNVTVLGEDYERRIHQETEVTANNPNGQPEANFSYNPGQPEAEETVSFESDGDEDVAIRSWEWDFGDGTTSQAENPEHTYEASGTYTATLTVTDATGRTDNASEVIEVVNSRPTVSLSFDPPTPTEGDLVEITADASDRDGDIVDYDWSIPNRTHASGSSVNHTFGQQGVHNVSVVVTDDEGAEAEAAEEANVQNAPPEANFTVDPEEPMARHDAWLHSDSSDYGDGEIQSHTWEVETVGTREGENVQVEFSQDGEQEVTLQVTDDDGETDQITKDVDVRNAPPEAAVAITPQPLNPDTLIDFTADVSDDDPINQTEWTFSDGVEKEGISVSRTFEEGGSYQVTLRVQDADGAWTTVEESFYVNKAPEAALGPLHHEPSDEIAVETSELFTISARVDDPDSDEVSFSWTVDGISPGELSHCTHAPNGNDSRVQCGWPDDGQHQVHLHARDGEGATTQTTVDVLVMNRPPEINPTVAANVVNVGELTNFKAYASDADGEITDTVWTIDGEVVGTGSGIDHTFDDAGQHDVTVNATDDDGAVSSHTFTVDVNAKPEVDITLDPDQPVAGEEVNFDANADDPDGPNGELSYEWSFDDGTNASGPTPTHTFVLAEEHVVELRVTDDVGATTVRQKVVDVDTPPLGAELSASPDDPQVGQTVTFTVDVEDDREIEQIEWDFGDGTQETTGDGVHSTTHTYDAAETFSVSVDVEADHGEEQRVNADLRVTSDEPLDVVLEPRLPDGQCLDLEDPKVDVVGTNLQTGTSIALQGGDENWQTSSPCTLDYTFPAGTWSTRDQFTVEVKAGTATHTQSYELGLEDPLEDRDLRMLQAPLELENVHVFSPGQTSQSDDEDTYANPAELVYVSGTLTWVEGTPVAGKHVDMNVDYRTPTDRVGLGAQYYDGGFQTPANGTFVEVVPAPVATAAAGTYEPDVSPSLVYLPGQYHVNVAVTSGVYSDTGSASFVEDPAGIFAALDDV